MRQLCAITLATLFLTIPLLGAERPNFIVINIDDLGYADIGPFGSNNATPHLDRMASEGRKLTSHYAAPVCSPSRASLMTGCYPKRALPIPHVLFPASSVGLHPQELTIAEVLKSAGYKTACISKWHLGDQPEFLPTAQGFDEYFGLPYSNDMGPGSEGSKSNLGQPPKQPGQKAIAAALAQKNETGLTGAAQPPLPLLENDKVIERVRGDQQRTITKRYTEKAVQFIEKNQDQPFFIYLPHSAVHFPLYPSDEFLGKSPNGLLGDWIQEVDASVGQILTTLRDLQLDRKTLVIFTSDNGGSLPHGSNNKPLRGSKGQTYEGGIRVCTIAWWPGQIPANSSTSAITSMMDILPTFAALANAELPGDRKRDGVNIWAALQGKEETTTRDHFLYFRGYQLEAVRKGPWKLHLAQQELYNLEDDISEARNQFSAKPEIVEELRALAAAQEDDLGLKAVGPGCRELGRHSSPKPLIDLEGNVRDDAVGIAGKVLP